MLNKKPGFIPRYP